MEDGKALKNHEVCISNRGGISLSGVVDVGCFDEENVIIYTDYGELAIHGEKMQITKLSLETGEVQAQGRICSLTYQDKQPKGSGFFSKVFK